MELKKKKKSLFKRVISKMDLFGTFITFTINGENDYKSVLGGLATFSLSLLMGVYICYMSYRFLTRKEFDFIFSNKVIDDPFLNLTDINFNLAFGIQFSNNHSVVSDTIYEYFNFSLYISININKTINKKVYISYHECTMDDYYDLNSIDKDAERAKMNVTKMKQIFFFYNLTKMKCPIKSEDDDIENFVNNYYLQGTYVDLMFRYLNIDVKINNSIFYNPTRYLAFKKFLEENPLEIILLYIDTGINYEEKINTLPNYVGFMLKDIDLDFVKTTDIFVSNIEFYDDLNFFISNGKTQKDAMYDYLIDSFKQVNRGNDINNENPIQRLRVKASPKIVQLKRVYQKFPSFIADLTGLLEQVLVLTTIIINFFEKKIMDKKLINRILTYKQGIFFQTDDFIKEKPIQNLKLNQSRETDNSYILYKSKINYNNNLGNNNNVEVYTYKNGSDNFSQKTQKINPNEYKIKKSKNTINIYNNEFNNEIKSSERYLNKKINNLMIIEKEKENNFLKNKLNKDINKEQNPNNLKIKKTSKIKDLINNKDFKKITIWSLITYKCCLCSKERKMNGKIIHKLERKVHHYLDIYNYIEKMHEIDLIKYCIFDEKQMKAFITIFNPNFSKKNFNKNENLKPKNCEIKKWELNDLFKNPDKLNKFLKKNGIDI